jgi:Flp pilus assembly protein TadD
VFNNLGYALQQAGRAGEAASAYRRALELDPHDYKARANLEWLRLQRGSTPGR